MKANAMKKKTTVILSIALVVVMAIGATLAYLATTTEEKTNVFTFAQNVRARLDEPNWDPTEGQNLTPGYEVNKDPMITNLSDNGVDEFVAIRLTFTAGAGAALSDADTVRLLNCLDITWNSKWELKDGTLTVDGTDTVTAATAEQIYVYNEVLSPAEVSDPVFSSVTIKSDISDADYAWLAAIIMDHTDDCYEYLGTHEAIKCNLTYKHHVNCALFDGTGTTEQIEAAIKGAIVGGKTCDCTPGEQHNSIAPDVPCPALIGTLTGTCTHTPPAGAISGFEIKVQGAAVQTGVEYMDNWNDAATIANLIALFN